MFLTFVAFAAFMPVVVVGIVVVSVVAVVVKAIVDNGLEVLVADVLDCIVLNNVAVGNSRILPVTTSASPRVVGVDSVMLGVSVISLV